MSTMKYYRIFTLSVICVLFTVTLAEICDDDSKSLCSLMQSRIPDMCGDPCLSKFCKRTCGLCPLTCYECIDVDDATQCTTVKTCAKDQYCFTAQTFTINFAEAYRLGCGPIKTCLQYASISTKRVNLDAGCCNTDKCNNKPPALMKVIPKQNFTNATILTTDKSFCVNLDDDVCTRLAIVHPNPCSDDCIASKICPHMCKKCFYCLDCNEVNHPANCTKTTACGYGKQCYGYEKIGSNRLPAVELGCIDEQVCNLLQTPSGHVFGRRDKFTFTGGCCVGDFCNTHPDGAVTTQPSVATISTSSPAVVGQNCSYQYHLTCPAGFKPIGKNCYHMPPNINVTKVNAERYCHDRCAHLVKFSDKVEILNVFSHYDNNHHHGDEVFTSLSKDLLDHWIWDSDKTTANPQLIEHDFHLTHNTCVVAYISYFTGTNGHIVYAYGLSPVDCNHHAIPMCYVTRS
ncbi:Hypothetical predicted protein [Mytilus galloprovincialis]|uniref:ShKT domain-containing protein n=1 Tax=Mytilus galloprovincialis TaxID=29158 RepID=A0A8B6F8Z1_MYTGA|nr:Hypothetical predicted protein [Mytilus galloprovincialis]